MTEKLIRKANTIQNRKENEIGVMNVNSLNWNIMIHIKSYKTCA